MDDKTRHCLSPEARAMIKDGVFPADLDDMQRLFMAVVYKTGDVGIDYENCSAIAHEILDDFDGDFDDAIDALLSGHWDLVPIPSSLN